MFRKNLTVVFKPSKNNAVQLPETYFRSIQSYENGCLSINYLHNQREHYIAWAPHSGNLRDTEIGINPNVARAVGLKEGAIVTCTLIPDVAVLSSISISTSSKKDWEMLQVSSYRIQSTLLDQTRVVTRGQQLIIWINPALYLSVSVAELNPNVPYGRLANFTEVHLVPYKSPMSTAVADVQTMTTNDMLEARKKTADNSAIIANNAIISPKQQQLHAKEPCVKLKQNSLKHLIDSLKNHYSRSLEFRVVTGERVDGQLNYVYTTGANIPEHIDVNRIYKIRTNDNTELFVYLCILDEDDDDYDDFPNNIYPTLELSDALMNTLQVSPFERITLRQYPHVNNNNIDRIELQVQSQSASSDAKRDDQEICRLFKEMIVNADRPFLINKGQVFRVPQLNLLVTATIYPDTLTFGCVDALGLKSCRVTVTETVSKSSSAPPSIKPSPSQIKLNGTDSAAFELVKLGKFQTIVDEITNRCLIGLCLDGRNIFQSPTNVTLIGKSKSGKSTLCGRILKNLAGSPYFCHSEVFYCAKNKGRKPESIQKDLRQLLNNCIARAPSVLVLDNLDIIAQNVAEQNQDNDYQNRVSDVIQQLLLEYTGSGAIMIIATVTDPSALNKRVYASRGRHFFHDTWTIPVLDVIDRENVILELCRSLRPKDSLCKQFAQFTEGYSVGDLVEFVQRAIFYAHRGNADVIKPTLSANDLMESLSITNAYCLHGIEQNESFAKKDNLSEEKSGGDDVEKKIGGLETVVTALEEVLIWPAKFPSIFENSPLRNQAGVLLFGAPGTGKTYLVGRLAKLWKFRLISVKGPELLAKYIGQSEENVRNLFERAKRARPCVLFFDEFDSLAPKRGHDSTGVTDRVVNQLLTELDGVEGLQGVIVIAATSRPELLDGALLRSGRIDRKVECPLPDRNARLAIFETLATTLNFADDVDLAYFAERTNNFTGADIQSILTSANMTAVKEILGADHAIPDTIEINQAHIMDAFENTRPSLSQSDIIKYKQMYNQFTHNNEKPSRDFVAKRATLA